MFNSIQINSTQCDSWVQHVGFNTTHAGHTMGVQFDETRDILVGDALMQWRRSHADKVGQPQPLRQQNKSYVARVVPHPNRVDTRGLLVSHNDYKTSDFWIVSSQYNSNIPGNVSTTFVQTLKGEDQRLRNVDVLLSKVPRVVVLVRKSSTTYTITHVCQ
jgi:hypothetical protein